MPRTKNDIAVGERVRDRFTQEAGIVTDKETVRNCRGSGGAFETDLFTVLSYRDGRQRHYLGADRLRLEYLDHSKAAASMVRVSKPFAGIQVRPK